MLGAITGAALVWIHYLPHWRETPDPDRKLACFCTSPAIRSVGANFLSEMIGTFVLVFTIGALVSHAAVGGGDAGIRSRARSHRNYPGAVAQLGECKYLTGGSDRETIALAGQAIRLSPHDPGNPGRYWWIGTVHLMQSRIDEAIPRLEKSRSARPEDPTADWFLAAAYGLRGDEQLARARLAEAIRVTASDKYSTIARVRANGEINTPAVRDRFESVFLTGLRKAGLPEE